MSIEETKQVHDFINENDLIAEVETRTKQNWRGAGSRSTYYNAVKASLSGKEPSLVGWLMLEEAENLMKQRNNEAQERA